MDHSDIKRIMELVEQARKLPEEALKLPSPRRFNLEITKDYLKSFLGNFIETIDGLISKNMSSGEIARFLFLSKDSSEWLLERKISREGLEQMLLMRRFQLMKGSIFTYRNSLCEKLNDMDIGSKVPMSLLRPPYSNCFIEFGPAETRGSLGYKIFSHQSFYLMEGAYVSFFDDVDKTILSNKGFEILEIDPKLPMRCLEISFTASPLSMERMQKNVFADVGTYISILWTNDEQTIEETLTKHFALLETNKSIPEDMANSIKENMVLLTKALLYLISSNRYQVEEKHEENLSRRLRALKNPAKARKLSRQLYRQYDRVVIGPDKPYTPISERLANVYKRTGVKPHIRRAHWSTRWSGPKKSVLKPVQIDATLVNAQGLSDDDVSLLQKDYDVK